MRLGERHGEIEYTGGKVIQWLRGSSGNVTFAISSTDEFLVLAYRMLQLCNLYELDSVFCFREKNEKYIYFQLG